MISKIPSKYCRVKKDGNKNFRYMSDSINISLSPEKKSNNYHFKKQLTKEEEFMTEYGKHKEAACKDKFY